MCDARGKHAVFAEARIDDPGVFRNAVAPVICMVIVALLATTRLLFRRGIAYCEGFAVRRNLVVRAGVALR